MSESVIETVIKLNNQTVGRDRLIRLLQYGSKLFWWMLENVASKRELMVTLKNLEYSLGTARKLLRLGRFLDVLYSSLKTIHLNDLALRVSITMGKINQALYLLTDHVVWLERLNLMRVDKTKWTTRSNKFWLLSIVCFLLRDLYELRLAMATELRARRNSREKGGSASSRCECEESAVASYVGPLLSCARRHPDVTTDTVKNCCDLFIPMTSLGYVNFSPGFVGLMGVISSVCGLMTITNPVLKLQPS